ncbi:hypothetical protein LINPERHAP1_LOCUS23116 [Linum perenne]
MKTFRCTNFLQRLICDEIWQPNNFVAECILQRNCYLSATNLCVAETAVFCSVSTSGRVLDSFRSSLSPEIVEALICLEHWFRSANSSSQNVEEYEEDLAELEDGTS